MVDRNLMMYHRLRRRRDGFENRSARKGIRVREPFKLGRKPRRRDRQIEGLGDDLAELIFGLGLHQAFVAQDVVIQQEVPHNFWLFHRRPFGVRDGLNLAGHLTYVRLSGPVQSKSPILTGRISHRHWCSNGPRF